MRTIAFDVEGAWALFRKPYAPLSPVSFPFPPPTAILGLLGAVVGYAKGEYHERLGWETFRAGVRLLAPVRTYRASLNLINTKDGVDGLWRPRIDSHHMQIPFEFLADPSYRIWVTGLKRDANDALVERLETRTPAYTPVLGQANCLAVIRLVSSGQARDLGPSPADAALDCVVALNDGVRVSYDAKRGYQRLRVPATMGPDRVVHRHPEVVVAEDAGPVRVSGSARLELNGDVFCLL